MSASWGTKVRYTLFGESHGPAIGIIIDGLSAGMTLDITEIKREMARRAPGQHLTTPRKETDEVLIQSGIYKDKTTGAPLCAVILNKNQRSKDYDELAKTFRPGHADYGGWVKFEGFNDPRGGGCFSGRLTAPLVFAGAVIKELLRKENIHIAAHLEQIGTIKDRRFNDNDFSLDVFDRLSSSSFPLLDTSKEKEMRQKISAVAEEGDSIGGIIETVAIGLPAGKGELFFGSVEGKISQMMFSIPAVKGLEFGEGFLFSSMQGSKANDAWYAEKGIIRSKTNHNGGIIGGLTTGMPIVCRVAIKPTSSIFIEQDTVNIQKENTKLSLEGRHDPCIALRALPVIEAALALALWDVY